MVNLVPLLTCRRPAARTAVAVLVALAPHALAQANESAKAKNPVIWADVPDPAVIRVGDAYYMSSTTMHMCPGLPLMKSEDLVNWRLVGYAYDTLGDNDALNLANGKNAYGRGSWASSLRFHDGLYYASTFSSTTGKTYVYATPDIERGPWTEHSFAPSLHDSSLFFDDDGRTYMIYAGGDIRIVELEPDATAIKPGGLDQVIVPNASAVAAPDIMLKAEGSHMRKIDGRYYLMNITWPRGGMRTQILHRADKITGPYEGRVVLADKGVAQGGLIDTPDGRWYALLFQDHGAVGRTPYLVPVTWEDGWPALGVDGKAPEELDIPAGEGSVAGIVASDDFTRQPGDRELPLAWQWNHNPDRERWSLAERPGYLRITTGRVDPDVVHARNTLTQRTFGPACSATTTVDATGLNDGDVAGMVALQGRYGFVGVTREGDERYVVVTIAEDDKPVEQDRTPFAGTTVLLRIDCDFRPGKDLAYFSYRTEGDDSWQPIGKPLQMRYTLDHFMGYRFGLFCFATKQPGGHADFDDFRISADANLRD